MKIGIFDSGKGGTTIMAAIKQVLPEAAYKYIGDSDNCPYGEKTDTELWSIVTHHVDTLKAWGADIIVLACNTATTRCIERLRQQYPELKFVGTEPAIKLAAESKARRILVMATPGTVNSERTEQLILKNRRPGETIDLLACPGLADVIEAGQGIGQKLQSLLGPQPRDYDIVVLGCTHYSLIKPEIQRYFPNATLIDGNTGVAKRVKNIATQNP